jgi:hypothetical protein
MTKPKGEIQRYDKPVDYSSLEPQLPMEMNDTGEWVKYEDHEQEVERRVLAETKELREALRYCLDCTEALSCATCKHMSTTCHGKQNNVQSNAKRVLEKYIDKTE